ncbi:MAG TPA: sugar phosphate nucleotidyltransferase [Bryobacteraceae bacterium]
MEKLNHSHRWGIILAGGDGTRLRPLTQTISGDARPKQFCPLLGGKTLLAQTRLRIASAIDARRTLFVLTKKHEPFYTEELADVSPARMIVQPSNRGTLPAILWSLLRIAQLDETASVAFFPSDHYYTREQKFIRGVRAAFQCAGASAGQVILLGAAAVRPEAEYGWIEPDLGNTAFRSGLAPIKRFWEKPSPETAQLLLNRGCLWNTFVMIGRAAAFLNMIEAAAPETYRMLESAMRIQDPASQADAMRAAYDAMPVGDFSKQVLSSSTSQLAVKRLGDIGWSDLGDPRRLVTALFESGIENPWVKSGCCNHCGLALAAAS